MDEYTPIETRRKSRSKTPFLRSICDNEACSHAGEDGHVHERKKSPHVKKHPKVTAIIEESSETKTKSKVQQSGYQQKSSAFTTSDYSSNSSEDLSTEHPAVPILPSSSGLNNNGHNKKLSSTTTTTTVITKTNSNNIFNSNWIENGRIKPIADSSRQNNIFTTPNAIISSKSISKESNRKEISQNETNAEFERYKLQSSTPIYSSPQQTKDISKNMNFDSSPAYQEYKDAGEYWAKYPKTDYTYSKLSPHRREVVPGVVGMPNMSRKSLEKHHERINYMIERKPDQESYIRARYEPKYHRMKNSEEQINVNHLLYDSQDELDIVQFESTQSKTHSLHSEIQSNHNNMYSQQTWITKLMSFVVITFKRFCNIFSSSKNENYLYCATRVKDDGYFGNIKTAFITAILSIFSYFYLLISSVLYLDTLILKTTSSDNGNKKRFLLFLLILLPMLLLAGWNLIEDHERNKLLLKTQSLIPISLIGFRNIFTSDWKNIFNQNLWPSLIDVEQKIEPTASNHFNYAENRISNNLQKSLSTEEYDNIKNHVNLYVQKLIDDKLDKERFENARINNKMSNDFKILIANTVRENILALIPPKLDQQQNYILTDSDLNLIIREVQKNLLHNEIYLSGSQISFNQDNLEEISKLIKSHIAMNQQNFNIMENIDVHEILFRIFDSPELAGFIDSRIIKFQENNQDGLRAGVTKDNDLINSQNLIINELNNEIAFIKRILTEKFNENQNLYQSIDMLKISYNEFMSRLDKHEIKTNSRFDNLLVEIDKKMSNLNNQQFSLINKQIKLSLIEILGYNINDNNNIDEIDLKNWIRNMFVAKEFLEIKLNELSLQFDEKLKYDIDRSGMIIMKDINEKLKIDILKAVELKHKNLNLNVKTELGEEEIKKIVSKVLAIYDADKTGLVDYALESAGGQILSTRCTENYHTQSAQISVFGIPLWYPSNTPRIAISPAVHPGECWAFQGFPGYLVLKLNTAVFVSGFTLEHIPKSLAPNGKIDSAPRNFTVWGLDKENDEEPIQFGDYEYTDTPQALQYFPVQNKNINRPFDIVELRIETNHGNLQYTCLYRFRVHGKPPTS